MEDGNKDIPVAAYQIPKSYGLGLPLIKVGLITFFCTTAYQFIKRIVAPDMTLWQSNVVTIVFGTIIAVVAAYYVITRYRILYTKAVEEIVERKRIEAEREKLIAELQDSLNKVKQLSGLLPICASCKKVRDDKGYWNQIEAFIRDRSEANFSHGICPECAKKLYPGLKTGKTKTEDTDGPQGTR
ncbi:MAG: hypothetical protein HQK58_04915 [Deltaproteobacteria bacterium]|nr:hypothetical protein [Deltaproteobacteria bacterium]